METSNVEASKTIYIYKNNKSDSTSTRRDNAPNNALLPTFEAYKFRKGLYLISFKARGSHGISKNNSGYYQS